MLGIVTALWGRAKYSSQWVLTCQIQQECREAAAAARVTAVDVRSVAINTEQPRDLLLLLDVPGTETTARIDDFVRSQQSQIKSLNL